MSLRATELEARIWRSARERMVKRPKLLAEYYRRRWGRWLEQLALVMAGFSLLMPLFVVAFQFARWPFFQGGAVSDASVLVLAAGTLAVSLVFVWLWYHVANADGLWSLAAALPFSDEAIAWRWLVWRTAFAGIFIAPLTLIHSSLLNPVLGGWRAATIWGTLISAAEIATLLSTTVLLAVAFGRYVHNWRWVVGLGLVIVTVTIVCISPIQMAPPGAAPPLVFAGRRLMWWPTGWPLGAFESLLRGQIWLAVAFLAGTGLWSGAGFMAALWLVRQCSIREFHKSRLGMQMHPLFERRSVWGPVEQAPPREFSQLEKALGSGQPPPVVDFMNLETSEEPMGVEEARREVLRAEFLQPLQDERLGWMEKVLLLSLFESERRLGQILMLDGRYWTRAVKVWWILFWIAAMWFGGLITILRPMFGGAFDLLIIPVILVSVALGVATVLTTFWTILFGWPGLIWMNSENKGLPIFVHLPISPRELSAVRQRVILLKLIIVLAIFVPVLFGVAWVAGVPQWPLLKMAAKLAFALFVVQSWWFIGWQLSGSFFRTLTFYLTTISLLLAYVTLTVLFLLGDDHLEWTVPSMVLCAKLMSWLLGRTLDRPVFDLTGANMAQQNRSFSLPPEPPKT